MSTPNDLIVAAYGLSNQNQPDQIASRATELRDVVTRAGRGLWAFAARINPEFFGNWGDTARTAGDPPYWVRPKAELVWRMEIQTPVPKTEVVVVPRSDLKADLARPCVWTLGQRYYSAGNPLDPGNIPITFFWSDFFPKPATIDTVIDSRWPEQFDELLIREVGLYLAIKDGRPDEVEGLTAERDRWAQLFAAFLEHETTNRVYRYGSVRTFHVPALIAAHLATAQAA
jgi:hypothetical protein